VLRHTAITAVERVAGFAVAQANAGHQPGSVTGTYTKTSIHEVASAVENSRVNLIRSQVDDDAPAAPPTRLGTHSWGSGRRPRLAANNQARRG